MSAETESVEAAMVTNTRLSQYTTDELLGELERRFDNIVFVGKVYVPEKKVLRWRWQYTHTVQDAFVLLYQFIHEVLSPNL